jgi:hypothetical protein
VQEGKRAFQTVSLAQALDLPIRAERALSPHTSWRDLIYRDDRARADQ